MISLITSLLWYAVKLNLKLDARPVQVVLEEERAGEVDKGNWSNAVTWFTDI